MVLWRTRYRDVVQLGSHTLTCTAHWVASDEQLAAAVSTWQPQIALDTEFIRTNTYYPMPGLYQVASGQDVFLLDPLNINDWQPFINFLTSTDTVKVMHACLEDLELLHHHLGVVPQNVFDTQYANAFLSDKFSLSYTALVKHLLDESLEQHQTRSNWLQRPLTDEQLHYAQEDVTFLLPMYQRLSEALQDMGRSHWFAVMKAMVRRAKTDSDIRDRTAGWLFVGGGLILFIIFLNLLAFKNLLIFFFGFF